MIHSIPAFLALALAPIPFQLRDQFGDYLPPGAIARMGTIRLRAPHDIDRVAMSPDGKLLVTDGLTGLKIWDAKSGHVLREIEFLSLPVKNDRDRVERAAAFSFSVDPRKLHVLTSEGLLRAYDLENNRWSDPLARTEKPPARDDIHRARGQVSRDGTHFAFIPHGISPPRDENENRIEVLVVGKSKPILTLQGKEFGEPGGVACFSQDNKRIAVRLNDRTIKIWDPATGAIVAAIPRIDKKLVNAVLSPDGKALAAVYSAEKEELYLGPVLTLVMWDAATGKELFRREKWEGFLAGFTRDGKRLLSRAREDVVVTDTQTWNTIARLGGHKPGNYIHSAFSPDAHWLITSGGRDHSMIIWDLETLKPALDFDAPRGAVAVLAFSPDGQTLASGAHQEQTCLLWDVQTGKRKHTLAIKDWGQTYSAVFSPDGKSVFIGSGSGGSGSGNSWKARQWNVADGTLFREFTGHDSGALRIAISPDGKHVATHDRKPTVRVWDIETGKLQHESPWSSIHGQFAGFAYQPNGPLIGVAADNVQRDDCRVWDFQSGKILTSWKVKANDHVHALSADTRLAAALEDHRWIIRDRNTGAIVSRLQPVRPSVSDPVAFSTDGRVIAVSQEGWTQGPRSEVKLFETKTGKLIRTIEGHQGGVSSLAFSPDDRKLATGGNDGTVLIWDLTPTP